MNIKLYSLGRNQKGETIITIMIAVALIAGVLFIAAPSLLNMVKQNRKAQASPNLCRNVAQNIINKIQSSGVQAKVFRTPVDSSAIFLNDSRWHKGSYAFNNKPIQNEVGAFDSVRWPRKRPVEWNTGSKKYTVNTPLLIQSSINALLSIYNANGNRACLQPQGISIDEANNLKDLMPEDATNGYEVKASLKIKPYNLLTGEVKDCSSPLWLRPYAALDPPKSDQLDMTDFSGYKADRGLEVEVFVESKRKIPNNNEDVEVSKCSLKERFHFDRIADKPVEPTIVTTGSQVKFSIPFSEHDPGTHLVCRSSFNTFDPNRNNQATQSVNRFSSPGSGAAPGDWIPCDRLTACGKNPTTDIDRDSATITNTYNLPPDCILRVEARVFDVAGNVSDFTVTSIFQDTTIITTSSDPSPSRGQGYEVGGLQFKTADAAAKAAAISGFPITNIDEPAVGMDAQMNAAAAGLSGATSSRDAAATAAGTATGAAATAGAALAAAAGPGSASAAAGSAASAAAAASSARSAANAASAAVASAQSALSSVQSNAGALGSIGKAAVQQAEAAVAEAVKQAEIAEAAAKAAEEAARKAEEAARAKEEAERESSDDDDDDSSSF